MQRVSEVLGLQEFGDALIGSGAHEDGAQQRLLGFEVVRRFAKLGHDTTRRRAVAASTTSATAAGSASRA